MELYLIKIRDTPSYPLLLNRKKKQEKDNILAVDFPIYIYVIKQKWLGEN